MRTADHDSRGFASVADFLGAREESLLQIARSSVVIEETLCGDNRYPYESQCFAVALDFFMTPEVHAQGHNLVFRP